MTSDNTRSRSKALSPRDNLKTLMRAFIGAGNARELHRYNLTSPRTIKTGLDIIASRWPSLHSKSEQQPVFIFSAVWRSGSTFLQRLTSSNKDIFIWGEPYRRSAVVTSLAGQFRAFTAKWPMDRYFVSAFLDDDFTHQWTANCYPEMQDFLDAHVAYFERLFMRPAAALGKQRWGVKLVTLSVDHAHYLRWLFPRARFIFLIRNPYDAYRSYRPWGNWYLAWPNEPVFTASAFGKLWKRLADDYIRHHEEVDGLLLQYESLHESSTVARLSDYLGFETAAPDSLARIGGPAARRIKMWFLELNIFC